MPELKLDAVPFSDVVDGLRDLTNALHHLQPRGVIVIDDTRPSSYAASLPHQRDARAVRTWEVDLGAPPVRESSELSPT